VVSRWLCASTEIHIFPMVRPGGNGLVAIIAGASDDRFISGLIYLFRFFASSNQQQPKDQTHRASAEATCNLLFTV